MYVLPFGEINNSSGSSGSSGGGVFHSSLMSACFSPVDRRCLKLTDRSIDI